MRYAFGIFIVLHGLVHQWYVVLCQRLVEFKAEMGWTGQSWFFSSLLGEPATRLLATVLYSLATIGFVAGGIGIMCQQDWKYRVVTGSAILSTAIILFFWDGKMEMVVEKGLVGLMINLALLLALIVFR